MTFLEAALEILKRERKPLHFKELTEKAINRKLLTFVGRTPEVTMQTQLTNMVKKSPGNPFVRVKPGVFGLLRYPEAPPEPEVVEAPKVEAQAEKPEEKPEAIDGRRSRRRRGGRGRRRGGEVEGGAVEETAEAATGEGSAESGVSTEASTLPDTDEAEEPVVGGLSAEARAAALAESGVLEGPGEEESEDDLSASEDGQDEGQVDGQSEDGGSQDESHPSEGADSLLQGTDGDSSQEVGSSDSVQGASSEGASNETSAPATPGDSPLPQRSHDQRSESSGPRRIMTPVDAAIEVLRGQAPGRGMHVRQIADSAIRRRLIHGEPNEAWRVMRAALGSESKERLRAGVRPRIKPAGSGLFALSRRPPDADLEKAEFVFGEARKALRERTLAALEQRLGELTPAAFEAVARVLLQREGFGPATFVKRVEGTVYVEALRGRGFRPSRCLIGLRSGMSAAGRRAIGELRAGIRARQQDEGLLILAGRLADDAISEWKQPGPPIEIVDGPALAETCVRHGVGVISAPITVELVDADFFAELVEG